MGYPYKELVLYSANPNYGNPLIERLSDAQGPEQILIENPAGLITTKSSFYGFCGDANGNCSVSIDDAVYMINFVFVGSDPPEPVHACGDANSDGAANNSDAVWIINYYTAHIAKVCGLLLIITKPNQDPHKF